MVSQPLSLNGKRAIVTGASSGIGRAIAHQLLALGVRVSFVGRTRKTLQEAADASGAPANQYRVDVCDVVKEQEVRQMVAAVEAAWGGCDILVNSAGALLFAPITEMSLADWDGVMGPNVTGTFLVTRYVMPGMLERRDGYVFLLGSIAGYHGFPRRTAYSTSKWAIRGFGKALSQEVRDRGVRVITLSAGAVDTPIWGPSATLPVEHKDMLTPDEVARAMLNAITFSDRQAMEEILLVPQLQRQP